MRCQDCHGPVERLDAGSSRNWKVCRECGRADHPTIPMPKGCRIRVGIQGQTLTFWIPPKQADRPLFIMVPAMIVAGGAATSWPLLSQRLPTLPPWAPWAWVLAPSLLALALFLLVLRRCLSRAVARASPDRLVLESHLLGFSRRTEVPADEIRGITAILRFKSARAEMPSGHGGLMVRGPGRPVRFGWQASITEINWIARLLSDFYGWTKNRDSELIGFMPPLK